MNTYLPFMSATRGSALLAVALLHLAVGFAFYSGLAGTFMKRLDPPPFNLVDVPRPPETNTAPPPPPPPPTLERTRIEAPPPENPTIDTAPDEPVVTDTPDHATSRVPDLHAPTRAAVIAASLDPKHPLRVGNDFYPDASRRAGETGRCRVQVTVAADGRIVSSLLEQSTGFERLDKACLDAVKGQRMNPATESGKAVESRVSIPIFWRLTE